MQRAELSISGWMEKASGIQAATLSIPQPGVNAEEQISLRATLTLLGKGAMILGQKEQLGNRRLSFYIDSTRMTKVYIKVWGVPLLCLLLLRF